MSGGSIADRDSEGDAQRYQRVKQEKTDKRLNRPVEKASIITDESPRLRVPVPPHLDVSASPGRFTVQVAWTLAVRLLMMLNSIAAGIIVGRWLGVEGLGQLAVINVAIATVVQLSSLGLPSANTYIIARDSRQLPTIALNSLVFAILVGGFLAIGTTALITWQPTLFSGISPRLLGIAAASIPFQMITLLGLNVFLALGRTGRFNLLDLGGQSFALINAVLALIFLKRGLWALVSLNTAASIILGLLVIILVWRHIAGRTDRSSWRPRTSLFASSIRYGMKFQIAILAGVLIFRADLLVVNHFRGSSEAGVYAVASQVATVLMLLPGVIATLLFPRITAEREMRSDLSCRVTRHTTLVMLLVCLGAIPLSFFLPLLYGPAFNGVTGQLLILLPGVFLVGIESVLVQYFSATGLPVAIPLFWILTLIVNICLVFGLVPPFGARGAAVSSTVCYALIFALVAFYFSRKTGNTVSSFLLPRAEEWRSILKAQDLVKD